MDGELRPLSTLEMVGARALIAAAVAALFVLVGNAFGVLSAGVFMGILAWLSMSALIDIAIPLWRHDRGR